MHVDCAFRFVTQFAAMGELADDEIVHLGFAHLGVGRKKASTKVLGLP